MDEESDPGAELSAGVREHRSQESALTSGPVIYVDATAEDGGDGTTRETAFNDVAAAVESACADYDADETPTVLIAPGHYIIEDTPGGEDHGAPRIHVSCSVNIRGEEPVVRVASGRAVGVRRHADSFATLEADPPLWPWNTNPAVGPLREHPEPMFLVTASGVDFRRLNLVGGYASAPPFPFGNLIEVGGGTGDVGHRNRLCPQRPGIDHVTIDGVAFSGAGIGLAASWASLAVSQIYANGNGIGAAVAGGGDATYHLTGSTFVGHPLYGHGLYGSAAYGNATCGSEVNHPGDTELTAYIIDNYFGSNGGQGGMRQLVKLYWVEGQPDTVARLNVSLWYNTFKDNQNYGTWVDRVTFFPIEAPAHYQGDWGYNQFVNNARNEAFFGNTHFGPVVNYVDNGGEGFPSFPPFRYFTQSTTEVTTFGSPPLDFDYDNPTEVCLTGEDLATCDAIELGNTFVFNGEELTGRSVTALPLPEP